MHATGMRRGKIVPPPTILNFVTFIGVASSLPGQSVAYASVRTDVEITVAAGFLVVSAAGKVSVLYPVALLNIDYAHPGLRQTPSDSRTGSARADDVSEDERVIRAGDVVVFS